MLPSLRHAPALAFCLPLFACVPPDDSSGDPTPEDPTPEDPAPAERGTLTASQAEGRNGAYALPEGWNVTAPPLALLFHATGSEGEAMRASFQDLADTFGFAIVAPDSRRSPSGDWTWEVGTEPGERTPDLDFAATCIEELEGRGLVVGSAPLLVAGHSGGASMAPYFATNDARATHFGVLHGGVYPGAFGMYEPLGWFSTGADDTIRPPALVEAAAAEAEAAGLDVEYHEFPGGHAVGLAEREALVRWWLDAPASSR